MNARERVEALAGPMEPSQEEIEAAIDGYRVHVLLTAISRVRTYADACALLQHDEAERTATRCADKLQEMLKERS